MSDQKLEIRRQWEEAGPGWARWEPVLARWMAPATEAMLEMTRVGAGSRVLDLACGAGNQTLLTAERVGADGVVVASDIAQVMLDHVDARARQRGFDNVRTGSVRRRTSTWRRGPSTRASASSA